MIRLITFCIVAIFLLPGHFVAAADHANVGKRIVVEREKRFLQQALDEIEASRKLAQEDVSELERQVGAINILQPGREAALQDLLDWNHRYYDWLAGEQGEIEADLAGLSTPGAAKKTYVGRFDEMTATAKELALALRDKVAAYTAEERRLAAIIDRRRQLQSQVNDLESHRLSIRETEQIRGLSDKERREEGRLRRKIGQLQSEMATLPNIETDLLLHYAVLAEQGKWEADWLTLKVAEYQALSEAAAILPSGAARDVSSLMQAYQRIIRTYQGEIRSLAKMNDQLDRKASRVNPTGTLGELERSRDLTDLYDRLRQRCDRRTRDLKVLVGAWEAELSELRSLQR
jgi:hypothetical protein